MQIVISNGLANFVTTFSDLAVTVTFGNFSKEFENFLWNILVSMMSKVNIRQSTADFWQSWSKFLSFTRGFYSILSTSLLKLPEISNNWFWLGCSNICKSISSDILIKRVQRWKKFALIIHKKWADYSKTCTVEQKSGRAVESKKINIGKLLSQFL